MRSNSFERPKKDREDSDCIHHWVIEPGQGGTSAGICKKCNARDKFKNYVDYDGLKGERGGNVLA